MGQKSDFVLPMFANPLRTEIYRRQREEQRLIRTTLTPYEREVLRRHGFPEEQPRAVTAPASQLMRRPG